MNSKTLLIIPLAVVSTATLWLFINQGSVESAKPTRMAAKNLASNVKDSFKSAPPKKYSSDKAPFNADTQTSINDVTLESLYESLGLDSGVSDNLEARFTAARERGASNDEIEFRMLASIVAAEEAQKTRNSNALATEIAQMLREMHGPNIQAVATELAYEPSPLLSEAAVDAAVASELEATHAKTGTGAPATLLDNSGSDHEAQLLLNTELKSKNDKTHAF